MLKYILYVLVAFALYYLVHKYLRRKKFIDFFHKELGFGIEYMNKFTTEELADSYNYVKNYSNKGIVMTAKIDPVLYAKLKAINDKYHIFYKLG